MPIRIYALAKDLNIDSKELVEICKKAGVSGKGSALASLTDEETDRVKAYVAGGSRASRPAPAPASPPIRVAAPIKPATPAKPPIPVKLADSEPTEEADEELVAEEAAADEPSTEAAPPDAPQPTAAKPGTARPGSSRTASGPAPLTRGDYIAPGGASGGRSRLLDIRNRSGDAEKRKGPSSEGPRSPTRREPVVKLAAIPTAHQPSATPQSKEPAPQKPVMALSPEALRRVKSGGAPLEQFTRQQEKKRKTGPDVGPTERKPRDELGITARLGESPAGERGGTKERRRDKDGREMTTDDEGERRRGLAGMASARAARSQTRRPPTLRGDRTEEETASPRLRTKRLVRKGTNTAAPRKTNIVVDLPCTVRSFSEATGLPTSQLQRSLMGMGQMMTINTELSQDLAEMLAVELGLEVNFRRPPTLEETVLADLARQDDDSENLVPRPPVVTFLGHVDHGKTSLLDRIIGINVASGEAGGITQHIRAYQVDKDGRRVSFVDTPGHEAFTEMRARGANVTDIAVLVVAADDGIMPQTEEAISHAKAAAVPIVVALNKIDLPGVDVDRIMQQLASHGLLPSEWGGEIEVVRTSATAGTGINELLETLLLTAELHDYRANPQRAAMGTCLEAHQEAGRGVIAKVMVKNGTLRPGDVIVCGSAHGRVKALYDCLRPNKSVRQADPSTPVNIIGLDVAPEAGESFFVLDDVAQAREIAQQRVERSRHSALSGRSSRVSFDEFQRRLSEGSLHHTGQVVTLNMILRADVRGSLEAIEKELAKLDHPEVQIRILQRSVGGITFGDVTLADASDAVIVGFNVIPDEEARQQADARGVEIRRYDIIYKLTGDIKALLEGKLKPEQRVAELGRALVQQVFQISRVGTVAGCRVLAGTIERGCRIRVNRNGRGIGEYPLDSLKREKNDIKEVREGFECGIRLSGFNDIKEGDILEAYKIEEVARTL